MRVLVAEDDPHIREGLVQLLETEGYECVAAADGDRALRAYADTPPDFVILDIMMPERNGYDVCREIRKTDTKTPILFLSAKSEEVDKVVGLELGADDFVSKPFGSRELMARVRAISRRVLSVSEPDESTGPFEIGDLRVVPTELRAYRGERAIDINPRDVQILRLLARNRGKVITRTDLFDKVWGASYYGTTRAMDQHISQLRKKIETDPREPRIILTVHGAGYRYE